jgi:hypothetical protein
MEITTTLANAASGLRAVAQVICLTELNLGCHMLAAAACTGAE